MVNKFDEKSRKQIEDDAHNRPKGKRVFDTPEQAFEGALYKMSKGRYGVPASGLKLCAVSACRFIDGISMTSALGSFHVLEQENGLIEIICKEGPVMDQRIVRVGTFGNKKPKTAYRPRFDKWEMEFEVIYNSRVINPSQLLNLYENAGFSVGLCEFRPEKRGNLGMFEIKRQ